MVNPWRGALPGFFGRRAEAPLELDLPAHLDTLMHAYERFPELGGRATQR
ncbi:DUF5953 family protein [Hyalangium sp.]|nr:DUF5953 family protein [Hyalangium sp.]HYI00072.1 DUF5953 family protein [Hyalangium sp.]